MATASEELAILISHSFAISKRHTKVGPCTTYSILSRTLCPGLICAELGSGTLFINEICSTVHLSQRLYTLQMQLCRYSDILRNCVPRPGFHLRSLLYIRETVLCSLSELPFAQMQHLKLHVR